MTFSTFSSPGVSLQGGSGSGSGGTPGGSTTQIQYNNAGAFAGASGLTTNGTNLTLGSASQLLWSTDLILTRRGIANLRLGAADAATAQAQILSVQSVVAGTLNTAGANLTITGAQGTGNVAGGSIIFQVAPAGGSGTSQNALANALTIDGTRKLTFADGGAQAYIDSGGRASFYSLQITAGSGIASPWVTMADNTLGVNLSNVAYLSWCNSASAASGTVDVRLYRDTTATLALRNGTAAQEMRVYETTTGTIYKAILGNRQLIKIAGAAFDDGAGASAGTITNAPAVGNPTKWIPIDDNGTTRHIPAW